MAGGLAVCFAIWSAGFKLLASLQHNALFQLEYPKVYRVVAMAFNRPNHLWDQLVETKYGSE